MSGYPVSSVAAPVQGRVEAAEWWRGTPARAVEFRLPFAALMTFTFILIIAPQSFFPVLGLFRIAMVAGLRGHRRACHRPIHPATAPDRPHPRDVHRRMPRGLGGRHGSVFVLAGRQRLVPDVDLFQDARRVLAARQRRQYAAAAPAMAWGLALMSAPLALTGISNFLSGAFVVATPGVQAPVNRIKGYDAPLAENPNDLALLLNLMIPLAVGLFLSTRKPVGAGDPRRHHHAHCRGGNLHVFACRVPHARRHVRHLRLEAAAATRGTVGVGRARGGAGLGAAAAVGLHGSDDDDLQRRVRSHGLVPGALGRHARPPSEWSCATR